MRHWLIAALVFVYSSLVAAQECDVSSGAERTGIEEEVRTGFPETLNTTEKREAVIRDLLSKFSSYYDLEVVKQDTTSFKEQAASATSEHEFYNVIRDWVNTLYDKDGSSLFSSAREVNFSPDGFQSYAGIGMNVDGPGPKPSLFVLGIRPDGPAFAAGLRTRDQILAINGIPCPEIPKVIGVEGTRVILTVQSPDEERRYLNLTRQLFTTNFDYSQAYRLETHPTIGYFFIQTLDFDTTGTRNRNTLERLADAGMKSHQKILEGLILDLRFGGGGSIEVLNQFLGHFFEAGSRPYAMRNSLNNDDAPYLSPRDPNLSNLPVAVLVDESTIDIMVWLAASLKERPNTVLIGQASSENGFSYQAETLRDGSEFFFPNTILVVRNEDGDYLPLENGRVTPDVLVEGNGFEFSLDEDPYIQTALAELAKLQAE